MLPYKVTISADGKNKWDRKYIERPEYSDDFSKQSLFQEMP